MPRLVGQLIRLVAFSYEIGASSEIWTRNLLIKSQLLWTVELRRRKLVPPRRIELRLTRWKPVVLTVIRWRLKKNKWYPERESNPHKLLRRRLSYPLNDRGIKLLLAGSQKVYTAVTSRNLSFTTKTTLAGPESNSAKVTVIFATGECYTSHLNVVFDRSNLVGPIGDGFGGIAQFHNTIIH